MSVSLLNNGISAEQAQNLAVVLKEHTTLKSLCGNMGNEAELDMSGKGMGTEMKGLAVGNGGQHRPIVL